MQQTCHKYTMQISRLTIDKLGIQMYDRVSAVLAELIANSYDADAEKVKIKLPYGQYLARRIEGQVVDQGFEILIEDDGGGMTSQEVNDYYLNVGYNRRITRSEQTPIHNRRVMGRKGIGKLAPFGICHEVEVITAGGKRTDNGYLISNLILNFDDLLAEETDESGNIMPYHPNPGSQDGHYAAETGTKLILRRFERRRVPTGEELDRQLAARFGLSTESWIVRLEDSTGQGDEIELGTLQVDIMDGTLFKVDERPVHVEDQDYPLSGWVAYAKDPYKDEVMAGVRIYARGKIVAQTRDFDIKTGFTGEFKMRSYLTGAINAEWLDDVDDLVSTDRQDIIWNSELGGALRDWGQELLRELAARADASAGQRVWDVFLEESQLEERLRRALPNDRAVRAAVLSAARTLVRRADRDSIRTPNYISRVVRLAYAIGPHTTLLSTLDEVAASVDGPVDVVLDLFEKARLVEMYSLGQVAQERVEVVEQLTSLVSSPSTEEQQLQLLSERAPWILYPDWTPLSRNQALSTTRRTFEAWYQANHGEEIITSAIDNPSKRPDFVMLNHEGRLEIVEIKRPQHSLANDEYGRAFEYLTVLGKFIEENAEVRERFHEARLTIVCDDLQLGPVEADALANNERITRKTWFDLLQATLRTHEDFLEQVKRLQGDLPEMPVHEALS